MPVDNCPNDANTGQADGDSDGLGDACDTCPNDADNDIDGDTICGDVDNCPIDANTGQADGDSDGLGDACDTCPNDADNDIDGDTICGDVDNCPTMANTGQADSDDDGIGDVCDLVVLRVGSWTTGSTHTVGSGTNRLLVFMVGFENNGDVSITGVTYGGQSLTRINGIAASSTNGYVGRIELWYLNETGIGAATGNTFNVTYGAGTPAEIHYAAATYQNVDQTAPILDSAVNATGDPTPNPIQATVNVTWGAAAVSAAFSGNTGSFTWGNGWGEGIDQSLSSSSSSSADHPAVAAGTDTASATHSGPNRLAIVAATLSAVP
jgi:hypothetical protein